ncbi:MAG: RecQ family ATP-dependent DNA helicase [Candidatus Ancaeobacter aquaticus]|nr:RecQ family ATP-dependent DNA helicase [Candidatus Ancaeobacter aquaticus]
MLLKTSRQGRYAGRQFYGCPNWRTTCRGVIVNIGDDEQPQVAGEQLLESQDKLTRPPVILNARERFETYRSLFFQNIAVAKELLDLINKGEIARDQVGFYGQWRVDFPESITSEVSARDRQVLLAAKKILTRGRLTLLSPTLEASLRNAFSPCEFDASNIDLMHYLALINPNQNTTAQFDGKAQSIFSNKTPEKYFYEDVLHKYLGPYYKKFVIPQVQFFSLVGDQNSADPFVYQQADFLITTPTKSFIVEIDDPGHDSHQSRDDNRNMLLQNKGFQSIRITNQELADDAGVNFQELINALDGSKIEIINSISATDKYLLAIKLAYQFQMTVIEALIAGSLPLNQGKVTIYFDSNSVTFEKHETDIIIEAAMADLLELMHNFCALYGVDNDFSNISATVTTQPSAVDGVIITFDENQCTKGARFVIQDITFPYTIAHSEERTSGIQIVEPQETILQYFLHYIFRFETFLEGQFEAILRALEGKDAVVLLPTGAGKSIAFQLASLVLPGVTVVIDPITALIDDQKENLFRCGIDRVEGITSQTEGPIRSQLIQAFSRGEYIFCYVAPERLQSDEYRNNLKALTVNVPIALIAIDEAHCVSEWGHDFRTAYLNIGRTTREYCKSHGRVPPLLALTGTASNAVLRDVLRELQIKDFEAIITPETFNRKELHFGVFECKSDQKANVMRSVFQQYLPNVLFSSFGSFYRIQNEKTNCGIVFCPWAGGSYGVVENTRVLSMLGVEVRYYSGKKPKGLSAGINWAQLKRQNASDFKNNKYPILVATKSFGMGIDKPNIRYTIHIGLPSSIESFYQEAGRAGRDRKTAQSILLLSNDFKERTKKLLHPDATIDELNNIIEKERDWDTDDDVTRALWFHLNAFRGVDKELTDIHNIMKGIGDFETARKVNIVFKNNNRGNIEKGVHRLLLLGVVSDYTIDYPAKDFCLVLSGVTKDQVIEHFCRYVEGYNRGRVAQEYIKILEYKDLPFTDFVQQAAKILIGFIYDTIEKGRRRAFREILSMAEAAVSAGSNQDDFIRDRILRYLETTYSEEIQQVLDDVGSFTNLKIIFDGGVIAESGEAIGGVRSPRDSAEIRGQVSRYLESYPDHPGLLMLRALSETYCINPDYELAFQNIEAACDFAVSKYRIPKNTLYDILTWLLGRIYNRSTLIYDDYVVLLIESLDDREFLKALINNGDADENMIFVPAVCLFNQISNKAVQIFNS